MGSNLKTLIDQYMKTEENRPHEQGLRAIQHVVEDADAESRKIDESKELTDLGKREAYKRIREGAEAALKPHEALVERLGATVAATRSKAIQPPAATPESLAVEREIRDRLMDEKLDTLKVGIRYLNALDRGDDTFVRAVESAPESFALISSDIRQKGEEMRLARIAFRVGDRRAGSYGVRFSNCRGLGANGAHQSGPA